MTHETLTCKICIDRYCVAFKEKGKEGRIVMSKSYPEDKSQPEVLKASPIDNCNILKEHEEKVKNMEEETGTQ